MTLTRAGWPRPVVGGYPVPWVSPSDDLASMDSQREVAAASGEVCAVCGGDYAPDELHYLLVNEPPGPPPSPSPGHRVLARAMDSGILHRRCLRLAVAVCPRLLALRAAGELVVLRARRESVESHVETADGEERVAAYADDCEYVPWEEVDAWGP